MKNTIRKKLCALFIFIMLIQLFGCGQKNSVVGEYNGTAGSFLKLNKDGTCIYSEDDGTGTGTGSWVIEDGRVMVDASNLSYTIYAEINPEDDGLLFQSDSGGWNDEYFTKEE